MKYDEVRAEQLKQMAATQAKSSRRRSRSRSGRGKSAESKKHDEKKGEDGKDGAKDDSKTEAEKNGLKDRSRASSKHDSRSGKEVSADFFYCYCNLRHHFYSVLIGVDGVLSLGKTQNLIQRAIVLRY